MALSSDPITWNRLRAIFGNPKPVLNVTERQFDYSDDVLQRLGRTPHEEINSDDLWEYFHDLGYVELQPELFNYLFPVCLMDWHRTLLADGPCSHGDSEFHYSIETGRVLEKMVTRAQREQIYAIFTDSFLYRDDCQREIPIAVTQYRGLGWLLRFNSLGQVMPGIERIWHRWWEAETPGRAVTVLTYCSGLIYELGEDNPAFRFLPTAVDWGAFIPLWENDSFIHHGGWLPENVEFIRRLLNLAYIEDAIARAVITLRGEPEHHLAARIQADFHSHSDLVVSRLTELSDFLTDGKAMEWTV